MGLIIPEKNGDGLGRLCRYHHWWRWPNSVPIIQQLGTCFDYVAKITTQSIHIMLCYFNGFVYRPSLCSQGQHFDIFMDNVDMVYMNIMICWNIICELKRALYGIKCVLRIF